MSSNVAHLALRAPAIGKPHFTGVVMPFKSRIDKIAAYELVQGINSKPFETVQTWSRNDVSIEQFAKWRDEGLYPIDLADRKYHKIDLPSACEFVVRHFGIERTPGVAKLLSLIATNNGDGSLKKGSYAIPQLLQDAYELSDDDEHHAAIIVHTAMAVRCFIRTEDGEVVRPVDEGFVEVFGDLMKQFLSCKNKDGEYRPFSLGRYLRDLWVLGVDPEEIVQYIEFWTKMNTSINERKAAAKKAFAQDPRTGSFMAGGKEGLVLKTDDRFMYQAVVASGEYAYRVIVASTGHITISSHRLDLTPIVKKLEEMEPGLWYYQPVMYTIMNGGKQYVGTPPTKLSYVVIVDMIQEHFGRPVYTKTKGNRK